jgi:hypothetical protein
MPWKETSPMNERVKFVAAMLEAEETFGEICERFGISRKGLQVERTVRGRRRAGNTKFDGLDRING